jgi:hypothetical protein
LRVQSERFELSVPLRGSVAESLDTDAAGQTTFERGFDEVRCEERERDGHIDLAHAAFVACGDLLDVSGRTWDDLVKPSTTSGNKVDKSRASLNACRRLAWLRSFGAWKISSRWSTRGMNARLSGPNERGRQLRRPYPVGGSASVAWGFLLGTRTILPQAWRKGASIHFFGFDCRRFLDILIGQFSQLYLRFGVDDILSVPPAFGGLISQINGAWRHSRPPDWKSTLGQRSERTAVKVAHISKSIFVKRPPTEAALLRFRGESTHESVAVPKLNVMAINELFGRFNGGGIVRVIVQKFGSNEIEMCVDTDDVGRDSAAMLLLPRSGGSAKLSVTGKGRRRVGDGGSKSLYVR